MNKTRQERYEFIYGNTARKMEAAPAKPEYEPSRQPKRKPAVRTKRKTTPQTKANQTKALEFDFAFIKALAAGMLVIALVSFFYLSEQSKLERQRSVVSSKKSELSTLLVENEDLNLEIEQSINLSAIQETAMKKYGMKKPAQSKVIAYDSKNVDYVRQYNKVPDSK